MEENFCYIEKYLAEWLKKQREFIDSKEWIGEGKLKEKISNEPDYFFLGKINELLKKFEGVEGFSKWVQEAKNSDKNFKHFLFELMALENLLLKADKLILKLHNPISKKNPEALIKKGGYSFYVEMTFFDSLPNSIINRVDKLFSKSREKFMGLQGIHFIGTFNFFEYQGDIRKPLPQFDSLNRLIQLKYKRFGSSTIAFIPTEFIIKTSPDFKKTAIEKFFYINAKPLERGGLPKEFFRGIFDVDEFRII